MSRVTLTVSVLMALTLVAVAGCPRTTERRRTVTLSSGSEELRDEQASAEAGGLSEMVWASDGGAPAIWSMRDGRDYFVPRVGLRFALPVGYVRDAGLTPSRHLVLEGPAVPQAMRGERLVGDRALQFRGAMGAPVVVSLLEIPMEVEPSTFCAWVSSHAQGHPAVSRDEPERLAESATRLCELSTPSATTRVRGFLRAGWLLILSQQVGTAQPVTDGQPGSGTVELDTVGSSVRAFEE